VYVEDVRQGFWVEAFLPLKVYLRLKAKQTEQKFEAKPNQAEKEYSTRHTEAKPTPPGRPDRAGEGRGGLRNWLAVRLYSSNFLQSYGRD